MTTSGWLASGSLAIATIAIGAALALRQRVRALGSRIRRLEERLSRDVEPAVHAATEDARAASRTARDAAARVGAEAPLPRVPLEPVTGPVVRAVAMGAGTARAFARLARPRARRRSR